MVTLEAILAPGFLNVVWKQLRRADRTTHLTSAPLVRDATGWLSLDLIRKEIFDYLRARVLDGSYRPHPPFIVEAAKSKLLRRRLFFLVPEDALLLEALVQALSGTLFANMVRWTSWGRPAEDNAQHTGKKRKQPEVDYEGWWSKWTRHRKLVSLIESDPSDMLVLSDITNFFGSIDLQLLRSRLENLSNLDRRATDLLFFILSGVQSVQEYAPRGSIGLPAITGDASRLLASFYLKELDDELHPEGVNGKYTRWVDDIVVSVNNETEGGILVARIERALAKLGLVPNSSKTAIVTKRRFREDHYEEENEFLEEIHLLTEKSAELGKEDRRRFDRALVAFLKGRPRGEWFQVLKRYYTQSRRARSRRLFAHWETHVSDAPSHARHILDYISHFPGSFGLCEKIFALLKNTATMYQDLQILLYEALLSTPFPNDPILRAYVTSMCYRHYFGMCGFSETNPYTKGLQALAIFKFGGSRAVKPLLRSFADFAFRNPMFATYAYPILAANNCCIFSSPVRQPRQENCTSIPGLCPS